MEKSGKISLTQEDLDSFFAGQVSERVKSIWGISYEELKNFIDTNFYEKI